MCNDSHQLADTSPTTASPTDTVNLKYIDLAYNPDGTLCVSTQIHEGVDHMVQTSAAAEHHSEPLPRISSSLFMRTIALAEGFWREHQRCLATCLLLSPDLDQWYIGVPRQRSGHQGVSWALGPEDADLFPTGCHIAGSWQYTMDATFDEIESMMPTYPGIHFVSALGEDDEPRSLWAAIRVKGQLLPVNPIDITADDTEILLEQAMDRITLV